ncbi:uncharacterized protein LOC134246656 [Saccostrea cucullata]|uniref:uncharacterized protein LOC134246656 n=1 Tax=Saccostrea cuccullata TaxID=36930 RepID=UPI002ED35578
MEILKHPYILLLYTLITFLTFSATQRCPLSARTEEIVKKCPEDEESTNRSAQIKKCEILAEQQTCSSPSKFKYHCLPTDLSGTLVEVCAVETYIDGVCVFYNNTQLQTDNNINCSQSSSCPSRFLSSEAHLYDPCKSIELTSTIPLTNKTVTFVHEDNSEVHTTVFILLAVIILVCIGLALFILKRRKDRQKRSRKSFEEEEIVPLRHIGREEVTFLPRE